MTTATERSVRARCLRRRYAAVPTVDTMVRRVLAHAHTATDEQREAALLWYARFARIGAILAERYGVSERDALAVLAVVSPRISVEKSVILARDILATRAAGGNPYALPGLSDRIHAAVRVLDGDDAPVALDQDGRVTRARKVRSFFANLAGDPDAVTLDTWALRAVGIDKDAVQGGAYIAVAVAYRRAAARLGLAPRDLQALVWVVVRGDIDGAEAELDRCADLARAEPNLAGDVPAFASPI